MYGDGVHMKSLCVNPQFCCEPKTALKNKQGQKVWHLPSADIVVKTMRMGFSSSWKVHGH